MTSRKTADIYDTACHVADPDTVVVQGQRFVRERTCHKELMSLENDVEYFGCSWCGEYLSDTDCYGLDDGPNYCGNCGAKVVE